MPKFEKKSGARIAAAAGLGLTLALGAAPAVALAEGTETSAGVQSNDAVNSVDDLKDAIDAADNGATITLEEGVTPPTSWEASVTGADGKVAYGSLKELVEEVTNGNSATITLNTDVTLDGGDSITVAEGADVTINGNGNTISFHGSPSGEVFNEPASMEGLKPGTSLTVKGVTFKNVDGGSAGYAVIVGKDSFGTSVKLDGCSFDGLYAAVLSQGVTAQGSGGQMLPRITVQGSEFTNTTYATSVDTVSAGNLTVGAIVTDSSNSGEYTASDSFGYAMVVSDSDSVLYSSFYGEVDWSAVIDAVNTSSDAVTMTLNDDVTVNEIANLRAGANLTVNGNGHAIKFDIDDAKTVFTGVADNNLEGLQPGTKVVANNVTFVNTNSTQGGYAAIIGFDSFDTNVQFDGCTFKNLYCGVYQNPTVNAPGENQKFPTIEITDASFENTTYGFSIDTTTDGAYVLNGESYVTVAEGGKNPEKGRFEEFNQGEAAVNDFQYTRYYNTVEAALNDAEPGEQVELCRPIDHPITIDVDNIRFFGNGYPINADGDAVTVTGSNVTLWNVRAFSKNGCALVVGSERDPVEGDFTIDGGEFENQNEAKQGEGAIRIFAKGKVTVEKATTVGGIHLFEPSGYNIAKNTVGFTYTGDTPYVGILVLTKDENGKDAAAVLADNSVSVPNPASEYVQIGEDWDDIKEEGNHVPATNSVVKIGDKFYDSLQSAVDVIGDKGTITLVGDCSDEVTVSHEISFTIDSGTHKFTGSIKAADGYRVTEKDGTYTIERYTPVTPPAQTGDAVSVDQAEGGKVSVTPTRADEGDEVTITVTPDEGKEVASVTVTDEDGNKVDVKPGEKAGTWTFEMPDGKVTVSATFRCDGGELCPTHHLSDVEVGAWYHDGADWAVSTGLMAGMADGTFAHSIKLSRAQLAVVLWNRAGNPEASDPDAAAAFVDVDPDGFYAGALAWCVETGAFMGLDDTHFDPAGDMTREQLAVVLWRVAGEPESDRDLSSYPDGDTVSAFADTAMRWAVENGVISGQGDGTLDPQGAIDRAQAAAIFQRLAE